MSSSAKLLELKEKSELSFLGVVAMTPEQVIGKDGGMPWHLPEDLQVFKKLTLGHPIVMGRKTFDSLKRPLPHRQNIVLTRDKSWHAEGVTVIHHPEELFALPLLDKKVCIIGGSDIFALFLPLLDSLFVSHIEASYEGDTFFPDFKEIFAYKSEKEVHTGFRLWEYQRKERSSLYPLS